MIFSLQGDPVVGMGSFNNMAEQCIMDQKVSLSSNISFL